MQRNTTKFITCLGLCIVILPVAVVGGAVIYMATMDYIETNDYVVSDIGPHKSFEMSQARLIVSTLLNHHVYQKPSYIECTLSRDGKAGPLIFGNLSGFFNQPIMRQHDPKLKVLAIFGDAKELPSIDKRTLIEFKDFSFSLPGKNKIFAIVDLKNSSVKLTPQDTARGWL